MAGMPDSIPQLFISYSRDDSKDVYPDVDWLRSLGFSVHIDRHISPGVQWREAIADAIAASNLLIFYASPASVQSQFCSQELQFALSRNIAVITVMLRDTQLPSWMEMALGDQQLLQRFDLNREAYRTLLESGIRGQLGQGQAQLPTLARNQPSSRNKWLIVAVGVLMVSALVAWQLLHPQPATIAVIPFDTDGSLAAEAVSANLSAELSQGLTNLNLLPVRALVSGSASKEPGTPGQSANYLIVGHVQAVESGYRIRTSLVQADKSEEIWAQTFVYTGDEVEAVQRRHVQNLLNALPDVLFGTIETLDSSTPQSRERSEQLYATGADLLAGPGEAQHLTKVRQLFEQALDDHPGFGPPLLGLCGVHLQLYEQTRDIEDLLRAETRCLQALAVGPDTLKAHLALGEVFLQRGEAQVARTHFQRASAMAPDQAEPWIGLADLAAYNGDDGLAQNYYERAIQLPNAHWEAHIAYGNFLLSKGEFRAAADSYDVVVDLFPEAAIAYTNLGAALYNLGEFDRASEAWRKGVKLEPNAVSWANLGAAYTYLKDYTAAAAAYREAASLAPGDHRWLGHLGEIMAYDPAADKDLALQYIQQALDLALAELEYAQSNPSVLARISTYEALLGSDQEALRRAREAKEKGEDDMMVAYSVLQTYTLLAKTTLAARERDRLLSLGYPQLLLNRDPWLN